MNLYLAVFPEEIPDVDVPRMVQSLTSGEIYQPSSHALLIYTATSNPSTISEAIDQATNNRAAAVFKLNGAYAGRYYPELWRWLEVRRGEVDG